jgi:hypothetical protein
MVSQSPGPSRARRRRGVSVLSEFKQRLFGAFAEDCSGSSIPEHTIENIRWGIGDARRNAIAYLLSEVFSKYDPGTVTPEQEARTWSRFDEAEQMCASTNMRFLRLDRSGASTLRTGAWSLLEDAKRKISSALGPFCEAEAHRLATYSGGASYSLPRRNGHQVFKISNLPFETTYANLDWSRAWTSCTILAREPFGDQCRNEAGFFKLVPGNKVTSVEKNWKTRRAIAIEPRLNMLRQKGIGAMIRSRLKRVGVDLDHGQQTNADMAKLGSVTGLLATIDLSMASDTVALELVRYLLPPDWLATMEECRSGVGILGDRKVYYRKFSSMGNGYTFELESLIFWALCSAVADAYGASRRFIAVYGDDLVVPTRIAHEVVDLLGFCGFKANIEKTFLDGPFRESCGKHYDSGRDVTPFYVKKFDGSHLSVFKLHNQLRRWQRRMELNGFAVPEVRGLLFWLRNFVTPKWRRPRIPDGFGDGAFIGTFDECLPSKPASSRKYVGWEGWRIPVLMEVATCTVAEDRPWEQGLGTEHGWLSYSLWKPESDDRLSHLVETPMLGLVTKRTVREIEILVPHFADSLLEGGGCL